MAYCETPSFHFMTEQLLILTPKLAQYSSRADLDKTLPPDAVQYYTTPMRANPTCHRQSYFHIQLLFYNPMK